MNGIYQLLTGATGALGSHILHQYRSLPSISKIYCLVRGADLHAARERVSRALSQRGLPNLANENADNDKIEVVQSRLDDAKLGLGGGLYQQISREATVILHLAWAVNFRMRLKSFEKDHIAGKPTSLMEQRRDCTDSTFSGVRNLINLALSSPHTSPPIFAFCSSVASCSALSPSSVVEERILENPNAASPLGYSRSKWVTEQICKSAALSTALRGRVAVFRVGQLSGDTEKGVWNAQEAWPMLLASSKVTGALPELDDEALDWLPVDVAAKSFLEAIGSMQDEAARQQRDYDLEVFHVLNKNRTPKWTDMLGWLKEIEEFEILNPGDWIARLEELQKKDPDIPAMKLLGHWKEAYGNQGKRSSRSPRFAIEQTVKAAPVLRNVSAVDKEYFYKIWQWIKQQ